MIQSLNWRFWFWALAVLLLATTLFHPIWEREQKINRFVFVFDITQSMNTRDYHVEGLPSDRLSYAKTALKQAILALPCGSQAGLGLFTHKNTQLLLHPIEVCQHMPAIVNALSQIDWRSAWAADSYIAYGLFSGLRQLKKLDAQLVFFTDGQQLPETALEPHYRSSAGKTSGLIVGVGKLHPSPIPKLDLNNQMLGFWQQSDLPETAISARYHPHIKQLQSNQWLTSSLQETHLKSQAVMTSMDYHRLQAPEQLAENLLQLEPSVTSVVKKDLRPFAALAAFLLLIATFVV